jgi:hypothetical protein
MRASRIVRTEVNMGRPNPTIALTRSQVQERLGISRQTFWTLVRNDQQFVTYVVGNRRFMDPADLDAWINHRKVVDNPHLADRSET